jgi:hypothetical protein
VSKNTSRQRLIGTTTGTVRRLAAGAQLRVDGFLNDLARVEQAIRDSPADGAGKQLALDQIALAQDAVLRGCFQEALRPILFCGLVAGAKVPPEAVVTLFNELTALRHGRRKGGKARAQKHAPAKAAVQTLYQSSTTNQGGRKLTNVDLAKQIKKRLPPLTRDVPIPSEATIRSWIRQFRAK